jgi:alpha-tubulin suppressor-like RCC1 family protein
MFIKFQGLNVSSKKIDSFYIENILTHNSHTELITSFDRFYLTFDSIYYNSEKFQSVFIFNFKSMKFESLHESNDDSKVLTVSSNTNYLYCLTSNSVGSRLVLTRFSGKIPIKQVHLDNIISSERIEHLVLASTDINAYLFDNETCLKCVFNLTDFELSKDKKQIESEVKLNENSTSSLLVGLVLLRERCKLISTGKEHLLFQTETSNNVYSFGVGLKGQLGNGKIENCFNEAQRIDLTDITLVQSGGWHSGVINVSGDCFMWGWNSSGQIGVTSNSESSSDTESVFVPSPTKICIQDLNGEVISKKIKRLSIGSRHSALIDCNDCVYVFGWNKYGQLFLPSGSLSSSIIERDFETDEIIEEPTRLSEFDNKVVDVKCGCWFTLLMTK